MFTVPKSELTHIRDTLRCQNNWNFHLTIVEKSQIGCSKLTDKTSAQRGMGITPDKNPRKVRERGGSGCVCGGRGGGERGGGEEFK